ncbi:MAG: hypothetical protein V4689_14530 [Verrucomicrobiota bacterium]
METESAKAPEGNAVMFGRKATAIGMLVCALVILAWFSPWWMGGRNLAPLDVMHEMMQPWRGTDTPTTVKNHFVSDAVDNYLVYRTYAESCYKNEGWVGWSSLTYGGTAQYANTMALYYDWTMQLHRWFGFWTAWHLGIMGQAMLAATGMLLFLRGRSIGFLWAVCGALAFAANSQFVTWINHRWALSAFCWVPWILWAIDGYRSGKRGFWALVPAFIAMAFLGGSLQHCAHVALVVVAMWGEEAIRAGRTQRPQFRLLGRYAAWGLLGCGLAAMMLLPCIAAYLRSSELGLHATSRMGLYPGGLIQPVFNLLAYPLQIFPSVLGRPSSMDAMKAFRSDLFFVAYFGSIPVLVAYLACFRKGVPPLARLLLLLGLLIPLTPLVKFLYQRMFLISIVGGVFAFAHFMQTASAATRLRVTRRVGILSGIAIFFWTTASILLELNRTKVESALQQRFLDSSTGGSFGYFKDWMQGRLVNFVGDFQIWSPQQLLPLALFIIALAGLGWTASACSKRRRTGSLMVALMVLLEVTLFGSRWITYTDPAKYPAFPVTPEVTALQQHVADGRIITLTTDLAAHMATTPFLPNTLVPYGVATIGGFDSIVEAGMFTAANMSTDAYRLGHLGVSHLITAPGSTPQGRGWEKVWNSEVMSLFENQAAVPHYVGFTSDRDREAFMLDQPNQPWIRLEETSHKENTRSIEVPAGVKWVRVAENEASGWEYRIGNGGPWQKVRRAGDASMLLALGDSPTRQPSTVMMRYNPPLRRIGFEISAVSLLLTLVAGAGIRFIKPSIR